MTGIEGTPEQTVPTVYFAHGKESGPWGTKILALAETACKQGWQVVSPDFRSTMEADARVEILLGAVQETAHPVVLVGSSMGGYVATLASRQIQPAGLFLMAPAFCLAGYAEQNPVPCAGRVWVIHGWRDAVVPVENAIGFSRRHAAELHVVDDDHLLLGKLELLQMFFGHFLKNISG